MTKSYHPLFLLLLFTGFLFGQEKTVTHRGEQWLQYNNITHLNEKWSLFANTGARWKEGFDEFAIFFARLGASYALNKNVRLASGLTYVELFANKDLNKVEFRPYEELFVRGTGEHAIKFNHRFRFEQRFYNPAIDGKIQSDNTFALRFRYALMTGFTLFHLSKDNPNSKFRINISDEVMFNAGRNVIYNVFDKNRFSIGPAVQLNKWVAITVAWTNQFTSSSTEAGHYIDTNALWVHLTHTINLSKKKIDEIRDAHPVLPASTLHPEQ